jgi:glycosyltransferase involved in cell wall biosynthesis
MTVESILAQQLPEDHRLEVVIAISDPHHQADVAAAEALATDPRVRSVAAAGPGPARARNAGIAASSGSLLALIDDDCVAQPGWLAAGIDALLKADLAQGRTLPETDVPPLHHSLWVDPPSWLWESCNLLARREAVERAGVFDDAWNPTGRVGEHFGEDAEWGWRMVRSGARPAFVPDALVHHAVEPRDLRGWLRYHANIRYFPQLFRAAPEARQHFYHGYFVSRRHVVLSTSAALFLLSALSRLLGRRRVARFTGALGLAAYLSPLRSPSSVLTTEGAYSTVAEAVEFAALVYGSVRWRRVLL